MTNLNQQPQSVSHGRWGSWGRLQSETLSPALFCSESQKRCSAPTWAPSCSARSPSSPGSRAAPHTMKVFKRIWLNFQIAKLALPSLGSETQWVCISLAFPGGSVVKNLPADAGDAGEVGSIPGSGRPPGGGNDSPLKYSCLKNPMDRRAWRATVHGVTRVGHDLSAHSHTLFLYIFL